MDATYLVSHWQRVRVGLIETIDKFADPDLDFKPYPPAWTVRALMLHIAQEENGEFNYGIRQTLGEFPAAYQDQDYPTITAIKALLEAVHTPTIDYLQTMSTADLRRVITTPWGATYPLIEMIEHIIDHEIHHRAELSLILGLLGRAGLDA